MMVYAINGMSETVFIPLNTCFGYSLRSSIQFGSEPDGLLGKVKVRFGGGLAMSWL